MILNPTTRRCPDLGLVLIVQEDRELALVAHLRKRVPSVTADAPKP